MKAKIRNCLLFFTVMLSFTTIAYASVQILWSATSTTYVKSEHDDNYFADTYYGEVSVRGADRDIDGAGRNIYYKWTGITYDVQGTITSVKAYSNGKNDTNQVIKNVTVKDAWNNGLKTIVYYNYSHQIVDGSMGKGLEEFLGGGILQD